MHNRRSARLTNQCHPPSPTAFLTTPVSPTKLCFVLLLPVTVTLVCRGSNAWPSSSSSWLALSLPELLARLVSKGKIGGTVLCSCSLSGLAIRSVSLKVLVLPSYCLLLVDQCSIQRVAARYRNAQKKLVPATMQLLSPKCFVYASVSE